MGILAGATTDPQHHQNVSDSELTTLGGEVLLWELPGGKLPASLGPLNAEPVWIGFSSDGPVLGAAVALKEQSGVLRSMFCVSGR